MYSADIEFPDKKIEATIKAPSGKHVIVNLEKVEKGEAVVEDTFDDWLKAHQRVDELNKSQEGKRYAVFNDVGEKTRGPEDVDADTHEK